MIENLTNEPLALHCINFVLPSATIDDDEGCSMKTGA